MAATAISTLVAQVRDQLVEATARFWTDATIQGHLKAGALDLWRAILDVHGDHYFAISPNVWLKAGDDRLTGVPQDLFRVQTIEPLNISDTTRTGVQFFPKPWKHPEFMAARALSSQDPSTGQTVYYQLSGVGAPINAPTILTAPKLTQDLQVRIAYNPSLDFDVAGSNPVPGESDRALVNWAVAYCRAKDNEPRTPDAAWLSLYEMEKNKILTGLTPRQEQEPEVVEDFFGGTYQEN